MNRVITGFAGMFLGLGLILASSAIGSEAVLGVPSMKEIAAQQAKGMVHKATDAANEKATQKIDEYAGTASDAQEKAANASKEVEEGTKKKMHEMHEIHDRAKHGMHEMQEMKEHGQKMMHEMHGK